VVKKYTNQSVPLESPTAQAVAESARSSNITSICVAPSQYPQMGLECVDVDDSGIMRLKPVRVDDECNLIQAWLTYLEPKTAGCAPDELMCAPDVNQGPVVRMGYSLDDGTPYGMASFLPANGGVASSSPANGGVSLVAAFITTYFFYARM
jgi:hypothetical protein